MACHLPGDQAGVRWGLRPNGTAEVIGQGASIGQDLLWRQSKGWLLKFYAIPISKLIRSLGVCVIFSNKVITCEV